MKAAARPKWWGFLCETTTDNWLARTRSAHKAARPRFTCPCATGGQGLGALNAVRDATKG